MENELYPYEKMRLGHYVSYAKRPIQLLSHAINCASRFVGGFGVGFGTTALVTLLRPDSTPPTVAVDAKKCVPGAKPVQVKAHPG